VPCGKVLKTRKIKQKTKSIYDREIRRFILNFGAVFGVSPEQAGIESIQKYVDICFPELISGCAAFRVHFAAVRYWLSINHPEVRELLIFPPIQNESIKILPLPELKNLFDQTRRHPCGLMLRMIYDCGIRLKEITRIRVEDVNYDDMIIRLRNSEDLPSRSTRLPDDLKYDLMRLSNRKRPSAYLFSLREFRNGSPMPVSIRSLQQFLNRACSNLGMGGVRIQTIRDSYAVHMLERGYDPYLITRVMGFKSVRSVRRLQQCIGRSIFPLSPLREYAGHSDREPRKESAIRGRGVRQSG
jgi:integrase